MFPLFNINSNRHKNDGFNINPHMSHNFGLTCGFFSFTCDCKLALQSPHRTVSSLTCTPKTSCTYLVASLVVDTFPLVTLVTQDRSIARVNLRGLPPTESFASGKCFLQSVCTLDLPTCKDFAISLIQSYYNIFETKRVHFVASLVTMVSPFSLVKLNTKKLLYDAEKHIHTT